MTTHAITEKQLDGFNPKETTDYLNKIGINKEKETNKIWKATKGYPYYLNLIRKQKNNGKLINLSRGGRDMVDLLLADFNELEKRVIFLVSYCRWFDQSLLQYLLDRNNINDPPSASLNWFEWLVNRDFVLEDDHYRFDNVARDIIRRTEYKNKNNLNFTKVHQQLAEYFQLQASKKVDSEEPLAEKYQAPDWCDNMIESTYHALFADKNQGQIKLLTHFFEGAYLKEPKIAIKSFNAVISEADIDDFQLLPGNTKNFLQSISFAIMFGWIFIDNNPERYNINVKVEDDEEKTKATQDFKAEIESALNKILKEVEKLEGVAKCWGLIGKYVRGKQLNQKLLILDQAKMEIEKTGVENYKKLSLNIINDRGSTLFYLERYEEALANYNQAVELDPDDALFWKDRGDTLYELGQYEEALSSFNQAIKLDPNNNSIWNSRALFLSIQGDFNKAIADINQAIKLSPKEVICIANKGIILARQGEYKEAVKYINQAESFNSDREYVCYAKACFYALKNHDQQALENLAEAIKIAPGQCRSEAKINPDFNRLRDNPKFQALLNGD